MDNQQPQPQTIRITLDDQVAQGEYVNFANIIHSQSEFVIDLGRARDECEEAPLAFEDRCRARQAFARQHRREDGIARSFGIGDPLPVGQGLYPGLGHRDMVVDGKPDRVG